LFLITDGWKKIWMNSVQVLEVSGNLSTSMLWDKSPQHRVVSLNHSTKKWTSPTRVSSSGGHSSLFHNQERSWWL